MKMKHLLSLLLLVAMLLTVVAPAAVFAEQLDAAEPQETVGEPTEEPTETAPATETPDAPALEPAAADEGETLPESLIGEGEPVITEQPEDVTAAIGEVARFSVTAEGEGLSYQWYYQKPGQETWNRISGASAAEYSLTVAARHAGYVYHVIVKNSAGSVTSEEAVLTVTAPAAAPKISVQPKDVTAKLGETAHFSVTAEGENLSYQWYYQKPGQETWNRISGATAAEYSLTVAARHAGYIYHVVVKNDVGSVTSEQAVLTLLAPPVITAQPKSTSAAIGEIAHFSVAASGEGLKYQWYYQKPGQEAWNRISGASGAEYSLTVAARHAGYVYHVVITNAGGSVTSAEAVLTLAVAAPVINAQPQDVSATIGETVSFSVGASGEGLKYQWYYQKPGATAWNRISGATKASYSLTVAARHAGYVYHVVVSNEGGSVTSEEAVLTLGALTAPVILTQPESVEVELGEVAVFTVEAEGDGLSYQWYYQKPGATAWNKITNATKASYSLTVAARHAGYVYHVVVTNAAGTVTSEEAVLTLAPAKVVLDDVTYRALEDESTCKIESYAGNATALVIPGTVEGMTVVEVGEGAFEGNVTLQSICLPNSIVAIRARAFKNCVNLSEMTQSDVG